MYMTIIEKVPKKYRNILIGFGGGIFLGMQFVGKIPGSLGRPANPDSILLYLGIGVVFGFSLGLIVMSKANQNEYSRGAFLACFIAGVVVLISNMNSIFSTN